MGLCIFVAVVAVVEGFDIFVGHRMILSKHTRCRLQSLFAVVAINVLIAEIGLEILYSSNDRPMLQI